MVLPKALVAEFKDLFDSKEAAVICYLSLERRYNRLKAEYDKLICDDSCPAHRAVHHEGEKC